MVDLGAENSRMKDYFDIDVLSRRHEFKGADLARALDATFRRRATALPTAIPPGLSDAFAGDPTKRAQWSAFVGRLRLEKDATQVSLADAVARIRAFLLPIVQALSAGLTWNRKWPAGGPWAEP